MNPLYFEITAGKTIPTWMMHHNKGCTLILDGMSVRAVANEESPPNHPACLKLTPFQCRSGLTGNHWSLVGRTLFTLYKRQNPCQAHQKP